MDFELTADQADLRDGIRKLLEGRLPMPTVRALEEMGGVDRDGTWRELHDAGVFSLRRAEADGGLGLGMAEAVLVFEELGRALVPGPLVATEVAAASGLLDAGTLVVGAVERDATPVLVEHLACLDRLVVLDDGSVHAVDPAGVAGRAVSRPIDPLTPMWEVEFESGGAAAAGAGLPVGPRVGDAAAAERWRREGATLTAALQLGIAGAVTEMAVSYAKERTQFGRPIGGFQAVKHLLADMLVRTEVARAAVYAAGATIDQPDAGDVVRAVSAAKVTAGEAAVRNGKAAIQVHGGMGFTWEVDAHLYLKRAWVLDTHFGTPDTHAAILATRL